MAIVSVIVPAFNTSQYISKCLDSIIGQTLRDIEIICIDDGSVDSTPIILDDYSRRDSRIKVIHVPNGGVSKARNIGLDVAKGEYISFVDAEEPFTSGYIGFYGVGGHMLLKNFRYSEI